MNAFFYTNEYVVNRYEHYSRYQALKECLESFLNEIKGKILSRKSSDSTIFFLLIDGLPYEIFSDRIKYKMDFLHEYTDTKGVEFENAYSPSAFTTESIRSIFLKKSILSDDFYDIDIKDKKNNLFYKYLKEKGFRAKSYGFFDLESNRTLKNSFATNVNNLFWNVVCDLVEQDKPTFYYIHEIGLFHSPIVSGWQSHIPINWRRRQKYNLRIESTSSDAIKDSAKYLDKSMEFYFGYFPEDGSKIIVADHGWISHKNKIIYDRLRGWDESVTHVPLIVFAKHLRPRKVRDIYSTFYLSDLLKHILDKNDMLFNEKIEFVQNCFSLTYDQRVFHINKKRYGKVLYISFKAFITLEDKYVITYAGQEYYYRLPDELTNLIDAPEHQDRIQYIKSKNDLSFPDFSHPKYKETRDFYFDESGRPTQFFDE